MPRTHHLLIALAFVTLISGCAGLREWRRNGFKLGPNYLRPMAPVADDWIDSSDPSIAFDPAVQADWWRSFNDPTLEELVQAAYQQNLTLRTAALRVLEARRTRAIAAGNLFPQSQTAFGQFSRNQLSQTTATASPLLPRSFNDWATGFDLAWEIDVWGRLRRSIEVADASIDVEIENYDDVLVTLIGDVAATYIQLRSFDERLSIAEQNVELQAGSLEIADARFQEGRVDELDVQQARSNLADTRALIPALQQGRRLALNGLATLLGTTPYQLEPILTERGRLPHIPEQAVVGIPANLLRRRPDVRSAERQIAIQSAQIGIAVTDLYPQFVISGEIALNSERFSDLFSSASSSGFVAPGFSWKILNYGRLVNNIRVEELQYQQAVLSYENLVLLAHREVEDAMAQFLGSKAQAEELKKSVEAAAKSVELVRVQYKEGATDFGRVFVLEANLAQAQDNLVATQAEIAVALTEVYRALGGGWQIRYATPYRGAHDINIVRLPSVEPADELQKHDASSAESVPLPLPLQLPEPISAIGDS